MPRNATRDDLTARMIALTQRTHIVERAAALNLAKIVGPDGTSVNLNTLMFGRTGASQATPFSVPYRSDGSFLQGSLSVPATVGPTKKLIVIMSVRMTVFCDSSSIAAGNMTVKITNSSTGAVTVPASPANSLAVEYDGSSNEGVPKIRQLSYAVLYSLPPASYVVTDQYLLQMVGTASSGTMTARNTAVTVIPF